METRLKVASGLMAAVLSVLATTSAHAAASSQTRYVCDARQNLVVERTETKARVTFIDRSYELRRKSSSIGAKYISPNAALIVDGASAVFVAADRLPLGSCTEAVGGGSLAEAGQ